MIEIDQFKQQLLNAHPGRRYVLALSGGRDSMVLFDLLLRLGDSISWRVVHVNHGLQSAADIWQQHCEALCQQHQIACESFKDHAIWQGDKTSNMEARARKFRYQCLWTACQPDEILLTGHHQDDQAETLLLQLLRGCGVAGLAAMPFVGRRGTHVHIRPLLHYPSKVITAYAASRALPYMNDPSNQALYHRRNFLRQKIIPRLNTVWPTMAKLLARTASHCAETAVLVNDLGSIDFNDCYDPSRGALDLKRCQSLSQPRQKNCLRYWFRQKGLLMPNVQRLEALLKQMHQAEWDRSPVLRWDPIELRRYQGHLYMMAPMPLIDSQWRSDWAADTPLCLPKPFGQLTVGQLIVSDAFEAGGAYTARFRTGGEMFKPAGSPHHSTLKQWFQQQAVPPWCRPYIPLIFKGHNLVAVAAPDVIVGMINNAENHKDKEYI